MTEGVAIAADAGAQVVCLQELTLAPCFAIAPDATEEAARWREDIETGPTVTLLPGLAPRHRIAVHGSLYEATPGGLGFNTAVCVDAGGLIARTRKVHIPEFPFYHEDRYFAPGDAGFPVWDVAGAKFAFPTCWDQWFPELARSYSLRGAEIVIYPTTIGNEPDLVGFDAQPLWRQMIAANGLANATFTVAVNRGTPHLLRFLVHLGSVRKSAGRGSSRSAGGARRRSRPQPPSRLAHLRAAHHPAAGALPPPDGSVRARRVSLKFAAPAGPGSKAHPASTKAGPE